MKNLGVFILFLDFIILFGACKKDNVDSNIYDTEIFDKVNEYRRSKNLKPFEKNDLMWELARQHSQGMADGSVPFGHDGETNRYYTISLSLGGGDYSENLDHGKGTADEVVSRWLLSNGHKVNIEGNFTLTAISAVKSDDGYYYYTQLFYKVN